SWKQLAELRSPSAVLAAAYLDSSHTLVSCGADGTLQRWSLDDVPAIRQYQPCARWAARGPQSAAVWSRPHRLLYTGSTGGEVTGWDVEARAERMALGGHEEAVMGMIVMERLDNLVTASLDRTVRVWDTYTGKPVQTLLGHSRGAFSLAYSPEYRVLASAGFDHDALLWSPFVSAQLGRLRGHAASLVGVQEVHGSPELITADSSSVVKIWDLRMMQCVQTIQPERGEDDSGARLSLSCFVHCRLPPERSKQDKCNHRIVAARGKRLVMFDQMRRQSEAATDELPVAAAAVSASSLTIFTAMEKNVKVWDAVAGTLKRVFRDVTEADITAICLDDRERKFLVGDVRGNVTIHNCRNGARMKQLVTQAAAVAALIYSHDEKAVLVAYVDGSLQCCDE
ncbi:unnamed protein product, partial [Phaeothamnion confervicola]